MQGLKRETWRPGQAGPSTSTPRHPRHSSEDDRGVDSYRSSGVRDHWRAKTSGRTSDSPETSSSVRIREPSPEGKRRERSRSRESDMRRGKGRADEKGHSDLDERSKTRVKERDVEKPVDSSHFRPNRESWSARTERGQDSSKGIPSSERNRSTSRERSPRGYRSRSRERRRDKARGDREGIRRDSSSDRYKSRNNPELDKSRRMSRSRSRSRSRDRKESPLSNRDRASRERFHSRDRISGSAHDRRRSPHARSSIPTGPRVRSPPPVVERKRSPVVDRRVVEPRRGDMHDSISNGRSRGVVSVGKGGRESPDYGVGGLDRRKSRSRSRSRSREDRSSNRHYRPRRRHTRSPELSYRSPSPRERKRKLISPSFPDPKRPREVSPNPSDRSRSRRRSFSSSSRSRSSSWSRSSTRSDVPSRIRARQQDTSSHHDTEDTEGRRGAEKARQDRETNTRPIPSGPRRMDEDLPSLHRHRSPTPPQIIRSRPLPSGPRVPSEPYNNSNLNPRHGSDLQQRAPLSVGRDLTLSPSLSHRRFPQAGNPALTAPSHSQPRRGDDRAQLESRWRADAPLMVNRNDPLPVRSSWQPQSTYRPSTPPLPPESMKEPTAAISIEQNLNATPSGPIRITFDPQQTSPTKFGAKPLPHIIVPQKDVRTFFDSAVSTPSSAGDPPNTTNGHTSLPPSPEEDMELDPIEPTSHVPPPPPILQNDVGPKFLEILAGKERDYSRYLHSIPPYIQAAFSQWYSQPHKPPLHHFLGHYFGRRPNPQELQQVNHMMTLRTQLTRDQIELRRMHAEVTQRHIPSPRTENDERSRDNEEANRRQSWASRAGDWSRDGQQNSERQVSSQSKRKSKSPKKKTRSPSKPDESFNANAIPVANPDRQWTGFPIVEIGHDRPVRIPPEAISVPVETSNHPLSNGSSSHVTLTPLVPAESPIELLAGSLHAPPLPASEMYEKVAQVGEGTYGKVYKARTTQTGVFVALKRIRMEGEKDGFPVTAMREIKLLQGLKHDNVVRLNEMMVSKGSCYMVLEYMNHDLTGLLAHPEITFSPANLKSLNHQMLSGLAYLHSQSILHRDMKGSNILLNGRGELKLADFGLARFYNKRKRDDYTNRVITLWYRSPELLLGETVYGPEVDTWSAGCIMLEIMTSKPAFQGNDEIHQLEVIYSVMGTPSESEWPGLTNLPWYELVKPSESLPSRFRELFTKWLSPAALDLAEGLLTFDPTKRLTATAALDTAYFRKEDPPMKLPTQLEDCGEHHEMSAKIDRQRRRLDGKQCERAVSTGHVGLR